MSRNLNDVLESLQSDKVKKRQEALDDIRTVFSNDKTVATFYLEKDGTPAPKRWLLVFQALFQAIKLELATVNKNITPKSGRSGAAIAEKRLGDLSGVVRWLTERTVPYLNKSVLKALFAHFLQVVKDRNKLRAEVALNYIKAMKTLLVHTPHLDHLEDETWIQLVELGFNVVLGHPLNRQLDDDVEDDGRNVAEGSEAELDEVDYDDEDESECLGPSRKRTRKQTPQPAKRVKSLPGVVTAEQIEFASLLAILVQSESAPILPRRDLEDPDNDPTYLARCIINRLRLFVGVYPTHTSLHPDYLIILLRTLQLLALNMKSEIQAFAKHIIPSLASLWGTRDRSVNETLIAIFSTLLPYIDCEGGETSLVRLWRMLHGDNGRWSPEILLLDGLRLEITPPGEMEDVMCGRVAFVQPTFRSGSRFESTQVSVWAILEMRAACAERLYQLSEMPESSRGKKIENPIPSLIRSIQLQGQGRIFHLQTLLFYISKFWHRLHAELQLEVTSGLVQFISVADEELQSWIFLCLGAIAHIQCHVSGTLETEQSSSTNTSWGGIWTFVIRKINTPGVCRAASHLAHVIVLHSSVYSLRSSSASTLPFNNTHIIVSEIEAWMKDLEVQGPVFPFDSVCAFISACIRIANKDVRLYRLKLDERALSWLIDTWSIGSGSAEVETSKGAVLSDWLGLFEAICGLSTTTALVCRRTAPSGSLVQIIADLANTAVIRQYLLDAKLPGLNTRVSQNDDTDPHARGEGKIDEAGLVPAVGKQRRLSGFLAKQLESTQAHWSNTSDVSPLAEVGRLMVDFAVAAICFETTLSMNGIRPNRRVVQGGGKIIGLVTKCLVTSRWTLNEKALVLSSLEPLTATHHLGFGSAPDITGWDVWVTPEIGVSLSASQSRSSTEDWRQEQDEKERRRLYFLRSLWHNTDVQDAFAPVLDIIKTLLRGTFADESSTSDGKDMVVDNDDFGAMRTQQPAFDASQSTSDNRTLSLIAELCIPFHAAATTLQSPSIDPLRNKDLLDILVHLAGSHREKFLFLLPYFCSAIRRRTLTLSDAQLGSLIQELGDILTDYTHSKTAIISVIQFLDSSLHLWAGPSRIATAETSSHIRSLCDHLSTLTVKNKIPSWATRDLLIQFANHFLLLEPSMESWSLPEASTDEGTLSQEQERRERLPESFLPSFGDDPDMRVRFRAATATARLFKINRAAADAKKYYQFVLNSLSVDLKSPEAISTRMLTLGNIAIIDSSIRRGAYWHILETAFYTSDHNQHVEVILRGVAIKLGLGSIAALFQAYASQIAYTIKEHKHDVLRLPPTLLGYDDRKEFAKACFTAFTPSNLLPDKSKNGHGERLFQDHCKAVGQSPDIAITEHLGEIVGWQIPHYALNAPQFNKMELKDFQTGKILGQLSSEAFCKTTSASADRLVCTVLRTFGGDAEIQAITPIIDALQAIDGSGSRTLAENFSRLSCFVKAEIQIAPYYPAYSTSIILQSLRWIYRHVSEADSRSTVYHVLHALFADIHGSSIIGEQHRLIRALTVFVALNHELFDNATLLHTLIHGAISMLGDIDLLSTGQSILHWALHKYRKINERDVRLVDVLVRIACLAMEHANDSNTMSRQKGLDLLDWIEQQAYSLSCQPNFTHYVARALAAWPRPPVGDLQSMYQRVDVSEISGYLSDARMTSNQFHFCAQLCALAEKGLYDPKKFTTVDFWRIKDCIPSRPGEQDIVSLAKLLTIARGNVRSFGISQKSVLMEVNGRHRQATRSADEKHSFQFDLKIPTNFIVLTLLSMLDSASVHEVDNAYNTLRLLASVPNAPTRSYELWHKEYRTELEYLQNYPLPIIIRPTRKLSDLLDSDYYVASSNDFSHWIEHLCTLLCDILALGDQFYAQLIQPMSNMTSWLERILPVLVHSLLDQSGNVREPRAIISKFFLHVLSNMTTSPRVVQSIINVVLHLRNFTPSNGATDALAYNSWLDIDFSILARKAVTVGAYTTALLFLELTVNSDGLLDADDDNIEQVMFDIYSRIDEPDGFYGIKTRNLQEYLIKRFHHEGQLEKAFRFHGAALEGGSHEISDTAGVLNAFHSFGFNRLALETFHSAVGKSTSSQDSTLSSLTHQLGWRTDAWDLPDDPDSPLSSSTALYRALRAVHCERDPHTISLAVESSLHTEVERLRDTGKENLAEIRALTKSLMCLNQICSWKRNVSAANEHLAEVEPLSSEIEFTTYEMMMATRMSLIRSMKQKEQREQLGTMESDLLKALVEQEKAELVRLSSTAREASQLQVALNAIVQAQRLEKQPSFEVSCEFANVLWVQGELKVAVDSLKKLVFPPDERNSVPPPERVLLLAQLGSWTSEVYLEKPQSIDSSYFQEATKILSTLSNNSSSKFALVYRQYALFAEQQYLDIVNSPDSIRFKVYVERKQAEISERSRVILAASKSQHKRSQADEEKLAENRKALGIAKRQLEHDREYFERNTQARDQFLIQSISMHSHYLQISDQFDDDGSIRLVALWFANFESEDQGFQRAIEQALNRIPSHKLTFLAHQLSARLTETGYGQKSLQKLILCMCREHPFHTIYPVYCLQSEGSEVAGVGASHTLRTKTAQAILAKLGQVDPKGDPSKEKIRVQRVQALRMVCDAYLQWAKFPLGSLGKEDKPSDGKGYPIPRQAILRKLKDVPVAVATADIPIDKSLNYNRCVYIAHYDQNFKLAGGRNRPKITDCYGNDGQRYKQLFKGEFRDDLRQDAVMEQVFDLVNRVLRQDRETRRRELRVRDYKVIPLSSHAGMMEFVDNTMPLSGWLGNAHRRYRPRDIATTTGQKIMREAQDTKKPELMLQRYLELCKKIKPVMRHYFTERFKDPMAWFTMRLHYTRSAATTSIVGHVLGLGDRHTSNILIDKSNGELVHIDLGISFDQGKVLPIPERVPFRMTRDMVDGMGSSGTQGVFQRCAEETLRVLRNGSRIIMTVLEVFKHDPLYSWTASDFKINKAQPTASTNFIGGTQMTVASTFADPRRLGIGIDMDSGTVEEDVDRALNGVLRKLDKTLSVECAVNELISEATDTYNLATIFSGWGSLM